jgi:hypothetical protein
LNLRARRQGNDVAVPSPSPRNVKTWSATARATRSGSTASPRNVETWSNAGSLVAFPPKCDSGESPMTISRSVVQPTSRRFRGRRGRPGILSTAGIERRFDVWRRVGLTATWPAFMKTVECDRSGWLVVLCGCLIRGDRRGLGNRCSIHRATGLVGSALGTARTPSTFGRAAVGPRCPR